MAQIKLYGYATSPFVRKVGAFLYYKQLPFDHIPVSPIDPQNTIGFTGGRQVPVLAIDEEWRTDSTPIGLWLDERFPEKPLLPVDPAMREKITKIDEWVTNTFMTAIFRRAIDAPDNLQFRFTAWRLAALVSAHTPLPEVIRHQWPDLLRHAPFIQAMKKDMDLEEPIETMEARIAMELLGHLENGPFLGGASAPNMVDLATMPQLVFPYMAGLQEELRAAQIPALKDWIERVAAHLPDNPILVHNDFIVKKLRF